IELKFIHFDLKYEPALKYTLLMSAFKEVEEPSKFLLSKGDLLDLVQNVIKSMPCEWEGCQKELNSWQTLSKVTAVLLTNYESMASMCQCNAVAEGLLADLEGHLERHCSHVSQEDGMYHCQIARCSGRFHQSLAALKAHIDLSHLSRVPLPCPIRGCDQVFVRTPQLEEHIEDTHCLQFGDYVSADMITPIAKPAIPRRHSAPLPLLQSEIPRYTVVASVVPGKRTASQATMNGTGNLSRKWSRLDVQDEDEEHEAITFDDLTPADLRIPHKTVPIDVRKKPPESLVQLSRPQPVIYPPIQSDDVPDSILYSTFSRRVDRLIADGVVKM
ncbi:hypothetical protein ID866_4893, partial [Astraeus odoratus]